MRFLFIFFLLVFPCFAEVSYEVKETVKEIPPPAEVKKNYLADIYINGNVIASGVEIPDKTKAKETCQTYITEWNRVQNKVSAADIENIKVTAK
jgi:hypothetical protein